MMNRFLQQQCACIIAVPLLLFATSGIAGSNTIDAEADKILQSMSSYLGSLSSFTAKASIEDEIVTNEGQKLQLISVANIAIERPDKVHFTRKGMFADVEMVFDGNTLILYSNKSNVYTKSDVPDTIDDAIRFVEFEAGFDAPGADLIFADSYSILKSGVTQAQYIGTAMIDGVECHHLAFRENKVDWQLWVKVGKKPLPMKYVITSKWVTAAPQFTIRFHDWKINAKIPASQFKFSAPKNSRQVDAMSFTIMDETIIDEEGQ